MQLDLPISATSVRLLTELGVEYGLALADCLAGTGIDSAELCALEAEVTVGQELTVVRNLLSRLGAELPGLSMVAGSRYHVAMHGAWGLAIATSPTVREAVDVGVRYGDLGWVFVKFSFAEVDGEAVLSIDGDHIPADLRTFLVERNSAATKVFIHDVMGADLPLTAVRFRHPAPADITRYTDLFGITPTFDAPDNTFCFDASYLEQPLPQANEWAWRNYENICRELLDRRRARAGVAGAVRDALLRRSGALSSLPEVARELGTSTRTLARRLDAEQSSFRVLADEVRQTLAEELLGTDMTVQQVAHRLGYTEPSSFVRAFRRWTGHAPQAYRRERQPRRL
ncbi:AraC family transcriptional regulator [Streptomyces sp. NPDC058665]|uniref:AraC family transcriptional regulator n=1 Tax=Streptomyces sp. NPDC058665 TaxID=3346586 RepID=UPI00365CC466